MPDQDDYPTCQTCEHFQNGAPNNHKYGHGACAKGVGLRNLNKHADDWELPHRDFGCILHSDLQDSDE
jgi:hypothetical protein